MGIKTFGLADMLREALKQLEARASVMFVYGPPAQHPDLAYDAADIMIISNELSSADVLPQLIEAERRLGCTITPSVYSPRELTLKIVGGNLFLMNVMKQPKIFLIGSEDDLPAVPWQEAQEERGAKPETITEKRAERRRRVKAKRRPGSQDRNKKRATLARRATALRRGRETGRGERGSARRKTNVKRKTKTRQ